MCAEKCANGYSFSHEDQDGYTLESYRRAQASVDSGCFEEIVPVEVPQRSGAPVVVDNDEEPHALNIDKVAGLRPAFNKKVALWQLQTHPRWTTELLRWFWWRKTKQDLSNVLGHTCVKIRIDRELLEAEQYTYAKEVAILPNEWSKHWGMNRLWNLDF